MLLFSLLCVIQMTPQDEKKTGFGKLTAKEKTALELWIEERYQEKTKVEKSTVAQVEIKNNTTIIHLSDGSLWEIKPENAGIAQGWINPDVEILIGESHDAEHPTLLTNTLSKSAVRAKIH